MLTTQCPDYNYTPWLIGLFYEPSMQRAAESKQGVDVNVPALLRSVSFLFLIFWTIGESEDPAASSDCVHSPSRQRNVPDRRRDVAGAEGTSCRSDGRNPNRRFRPLLDPLLPDRADHAALLMARPTRLEKRLPVARLLQLIL